MRESCFKQTTAPDSDHRFGTRVAVSASEGTFAGAAGQHAALAARHESTTWRRICATNLLREKAYKAADLIVPSGWNRQL